MTEQIVIDRIKQTKHKLDEGLINDLVKVIASVGIIYPPILWRPGTALGINLVIGADVIEACRRLKMKAITARVVTGDTPDIRDWCDRVRGAQSVWEAAA